MHKGFGWLTFSLMCLIVATGLFLGPFMHVLKKRKPAWYSMVSIACQATWGAGPGHPKHSLACLCSRTRSHSCTSRPVLPAHLQPPILPIHTSLAAPLPQFLVLFQTLAMALLLSSSVTVVLGITTYVSRFRAEIDTMEPLW